MKSCGQIFADIFLKIFFWKTEGLHGFSSEKKAVVVMAPHTSIWDFVVGKCVVTKYGRKAGFFIKKEAFNWFIIDPLLKKWGGIPINRGHRNTHVEDAVERLNNSDDLWIVITPEGTRKKVKRWKSGFYRIAMDAKVPILISYVDYKTRVATVVAKFYPTGDYKADLEKIMPYYDGVTGLFMKRKM